ncbi:MAG: HAMP domain-containing sensor histidine kinase [Acetivibrio sp.]
MFTYAELMELEDLCKEDKRFEKYVERLKEENNRLLTKVAHEIGNPLTIIYSTIQLMESRNPEIAKEKYWTQLTQDVKELSLLLRDYSDYNSCDSLNITKEDLSEVLQNLVQSFEPVFIHHSIDWSFQVPQDMVPVMASYLCDKIKLKQVFVNIFKNALEASAENGRIWLCVPPKGSVLDCGIQGEDSIAIQIGNTGVPIKKNELKNLFSPSSSIKCGGCGIGLSISNKIAEAHGGKISVSSNKESTIFTVCLPL